MFSHRNWTPRKLQLNLTAPNRPQGEGGPVESYSGRILVEDASGARFYVHEYRGRRTFLRVRRFMLDTGEQVRRVDARSFVIAATGERLTRVEED
jgi:hypothetical protein